jgi:twitching motility two-component system response regulator PilH
MLERGGFHSVMTAPNAEEGVARARSEQPDLILMDVIMPGMNGFQATRTLSKDPETSSIPVIIVSTKNMETDRVWGLRQGAKDFVSKPPVERDLLARIQAAARPAREETIDGRPARDTLAESLRRSSLIYERRSLAHVAGLPEQLDAPGLWRGDRIPAR